MDFTINLLIDFRYTTKIAFMHKNDFALNNSKLTHNLLDLELITKIRENIDAHRIKLNIVKERDFTVHYIRNLVQYTNIKLIDTDKTSK